MIKSKKNIFLIFLALLSVVAIIVSIATYAWLLSKIKDSINKKVEIKNEMVLIEKQNEDIKKLKKALRDTKEDRVKVASYFLSNEDLTNFLSNLEDIRSITGAFVKIKSVGVTDVIQKNNSIVALSIDIQSKGKIQSVIRTLTILETIPIVSSIKSVKVTQDPKSRIWTGDFKLNVLKLN